MAIGRRVLAKACVVHTSCFLVGKKCVVQENSWAPVWFSLRHQHNVSTSNIRGSEGDGYGCLVKNSCFLGLKKSAGI